MLPFSDAKHPISECSTLKQIRKTACDVGADRRARPTSLFQTLLVTHKEQGEKLPDPTPQAESPILAQIF
jgi:hypothetical protein